MNESTMNEFNTDLKFQELSNEQIDEVSGGFAPATWGLYLAGTALGWNVGQALWGE